MTYSPELGYAIPLPFENVYSLFGRNKQSNNKQHKQVIESILSLLLHVCL